MEAFNRNLKIGFSMLVKIYENELKSKENDLLINMIITKVKPMTENISEEKQKQNIDLFIEETSEHWDLFLKNDPLNLVKICPFVAGYVNLAKNTAAKDTPLLAMVPDFEAQFFEVLLSKMSNESKASLNRFIVRQIQLSKEYQSRK